MATDRKLRWYHRWRWWLYPGNWAENWRIRHYVPTPTANDRLLAVAGGKWGLENYQTAGANTTHDGWRGRHWSGVHKSGQYLTFAGKHQDAYE